MKSCSMPWFPLRHSLIGLGGGFEAQLYMLFFFFVLAYGCETWVPSKSDEARLGVFERNVLRAIFVPKNDNGEWRIKYSDELYTLYKDSDIITYIKINPLNPELNPICYMLALLGAHHFLHVSRIRVKLLTFRLLMSYIYIYIWSTHS